MNDAFYEYMIRVGLMMAVSLILIWSGSKGVMEYILITSVLFIMYDIIQIRRNTAPVRTTIK